MARTTILFFTIFSFLFVLSMAQDSPSPGAPGTSPAPGAPSAPSAPGAPAPSPGVPTGAPGTAPVAPTPSTPVQPPRCQVETYSSFQPQKLNQVKTVTGTQAPVTISGEVSILDSCTLLIKDFNYYFAATGSYWYGSNSTDFNAFKILVSTKPVAQSQTTTVNYTLTSNVTFNDFNVLNLYSNDDKQVYAQAVLRTPPTPTTAASVDSSNPTQSDATRLPTNLNIITKTIIGALVVWLSFV